MSFKRVHVIFASTQDLSENNWVFKDPTAFKFAELIILIISYIQFRSVDLFTYFCEELINNLFANDVDPNLGSYG
jgi:hypothetical protein